MGYEGFDCICRWPIFCWRESCECLLGGIGGVSVPGPKVRRSIRDEPALCRLFPKKNSTFHLFRRPGSINHLFCFILGGKMGKRGKCQRKKAWLLQGTDLGNLVNSNSRPAQLVCFSYFTIWCVPSIPLPRSCPVLFFISARFLVSFAQFSFLSFNFSFVEFY